MADKAFFVWWSSLWKQVIALILLAVVAANLLIALLSQQRCQIKMKEEAWAHQAALETLQQRLLSAELADANWAAELDALGLALFQEAPLMLELRINDTNGRAIWAKEAPQFLSALMGELSVEVIKNGIRPFGENARGGAAVCVITIPLSGNAADYTLRGVYQWSETVRRYVKVTHITLYLTAVTILGMLVFAAGALLLRFSQRLAAKRQQVEEYAVAVEEANMQLRRTRKELYLSEKLASLGYLSAGIAHEIGNPLSAVLGYIEILQKGKLDEKKRADILPRIVREIERMRGIIQELVTFSRPHSLNIQKADVNQIMQKMLANFPPVKDKQIEFHLQLTEFPLWADVDAHKLQSVCVNIIQNSIDAIDLAGKITIATSRRIRESTTMIGGSEVVAIQIADTGCGIPEEILPSVFDPFFTTKEPGKGMGLGLSLCHRMIESFHGEIEVTSKVGEGTEVLIVLPPSRKKESGQESPESEAI